MSEIIDQIRQQLVANILTGPKPPPDEMALLSRAYQDVWRAEDEQSGDAPLAAVLDEPGQWFPKPTTPAEHALGQETERLLRKKRWVESEQLASLARIEKLLAGDEQWRHTVLEHNRKLSQAIEACRAECERAPTPVRAETARRRILEFQKAQRANLRKVAELERKEEKLLSAARHNAVEYLGIVKRLEARKGYWKLLRNRERASGGGLGILGTLGAILAINDFQKMAHGIDRLAKKSWPLQEDGGSR